MSFKKLESGKSALTMPIVYSLSLMLLLSPLSILKPSVVWAANRTDDKSSSSKESGKASSKKSSDTNKDKKKDTKKKAGDSLDQDTLKSTELDKETLSLLNVGDFDAAARHLQDMAGKKDYNQSMAVWQAFAHMYLSRCNDCRNVLADLNKQDKTKVDGSDLLLINAIKALCEKDLPAAKSALESLPESQLNTPIANLCWAAYAAKSGDQSLALEKLNKVAVAAPNLTFTYRTIGFIQLYLLKDLTKAKEAFEKALKIEPKMQDSRDMYMQALQLEGDYDAAIDLAQEGIKLNPKNASAYFSLAKVYISQSRLREAVEALEKAIALKNDNPSFYRAMANIYNRKKDFVAAISNTKLALNYDQSTDKSADMLNLAKLQIAVGQRDEAENTLKDILKLDPESTEAGNVYINLLSGQKRFKDLVALYKSFVDRSPKDADLRLKYAHALQAADQIDGAVNEYKEAANLYQIKLAQGDNNAKHPEIHVALAKIYIDKNDFDQAIKEYKRALNLDPNSPDVLSALAYCYAQSGDFRRAEAALVTAIAINQVVPTGDHVDKQNKLMRALSEVFLLEGRYSDARLQLDAIAKTNKKAEDKNIDQFLLAQAGALCDRNESTAKELSAKYDALSAKEKEICLNAFLDTLVNMGKPDLAAGELAKVADIKDKKSVELLVTAARTKRLSGDSDGALELLSLPICAEAKDKLDQVSVNTELGILYQAKGDNEKAEAYLKKAINEETNSYKTYEALAQFALNTKDYLKAASYANQAISINPYSAQAHCILGDIQAQKDKLKEAIQSYKRAQELYPNYLPAHEALLNLYQKTGQNDAAKEEEEAIKQLKS